MFFGLLGNSISVHRKLLSYVQAIIFYCYQDGYVCVVFSNPRNTLHGDGDLERLIILTEITVK